MDKLNDIKARIAAMAKFFVPMEYMKSVEECLEADNYIPPVASFYAHAREDIPYLLSVISEKDKEIERLRQLSIESCARCACNILDSRDSAIERAEKAEAEIKNLKISAQNWHEHHEV